MSRFLVRNRTTRTRKGSQADPTTSANGSGSPDDVGNGIDVNSTDYATKCRLLMDLSRDLRQLGADSLINFPRLVVIGGQSAGKSSLVEAVSGINVPRDAGTCTRCPMEISMSRSAEAWSCTISIESGAATGDVPSFTQFGRKLTDKGAVDIWLRRAQTALLNPHLSPETFLDQTASELRNLIRTDPAMLKFSEKRVIVNIQDPDGANLHFVDLPGLIQNEERAVIDLVKGLVEANIEPSNTLIVIAIPMSDDMENQQAVRLAKESDPDGARTIGVLTKPDTIPTGSINSRQRWKDILEGKEQATRHGYYCVRLPDDADRARKITRRESEQQSTDYFNGTRPWNEFADRSRFGIPNFVADISKLLVQMIETSLPSLKQDVNQLLLDCTSELNKLPVPVTVHHATEILNRITAFCDDLKGAIFAKKITGLANSNRARYNEFKADIRNTAPDFRPYENPEEHKRPNYREPDVDDDALPPPTGSQTLGLLDVRRIIVESTGWELPGHVPFEATKRLIMDFVKLWKDPTKACFGDINGYLTDLVDDLIKSNFSRFKQLESFMKGLIWTEFEECRQKALRSLQQTLLREELPFTQNIPYFTSTTKQWLTRYRNAMPCKVAEGPWPLDDGYTSELEVMAGVRAYFQVAYKRIIDDVPLTIEKELTRAFADNIQETLFQKLFTGDDAPTVEQMKDLLVEDPAVAARRESLMTKRDRLVEIKRKLDRFTD